MSDPASPFGSVPSGADFLAQQSSAYQADQDARAAKDDAAQAQAVVAADPAAAPPVDPYAAYRQPKATYEVYAHDGKQYADSIDSLLALRGKTDEAGKSFDEYTIPVRAPDGARRGVTLGQIDDALAQGFKLENAQESRIQRFLESDRGLKGDVRAGLYNAGNQLTFGIAGKIADAVLTPEEKAQRDAALSEHEYAADVGSAAGFVGSFFTGAPLFKAAGRAAEITELAMSRVLASRAAQAGVELGAPAAQSLAARILTGAAKLGAEATVIAAPDAVTEAALGDPKDAAETLVFAFGAGAILGGVGAGGKALLQRAFRGVEGARVVTAAERTAAAEKKTIQDAAAREAEAVGNPEAERAEWDQKHADVEAAKAPKDHHGVPVTTVDAATEAYINQHKSLTGEERSALERVAKEGLGKKTVQEDLLNENSRQLAKLGDEVLRVDDGVLGKTAFGESRDAMLANKVDPEKWERAAEVVDSTRKHVEGVIKHLESLPAGEQTGPIRRIRSALESFDHRELWSRASGQAAPGILRDSYLYLQKLKQDIGRASGFGKLGKEMTYAEEVADKLYRDIKPVLEDESAWGAAATATKDVNLATTNKLERVKTLNEAFVDRSTNQEGRAIREFDPASMESYLSHVDGPKADMKEKALRGWFDGMRNLMAATEKHHDLSPAKLAEFAKAREAIGAFESGIDQAKKNARALRTIRGMQENEAGKGANFMGLGLVFDALSKPMTTVERMHHVREYAERAEKLGVLAAEQAQRHAGDKLDEVPGILKSMGSRAAAAASTARAAANVDGGKVTARAISAIVGERAVSKNRDDQFRTLRDKIVNAQANVEGTSDRIGEHASGLSRGGAPTIANEYIVKQQQILAYLARELPKAPPHTMFGPKVDAMPSPREIIEYERKVEAVHDPIGTITRNLAAGTLTATHVKAVEENYPGMLAKIRERIMRAAADPKAPTLSATNRARLAVLMGSGAAKPADAARYQQPYAAPVKGNPSGPGIDKLPEVGTNIQRISGG